VLGGQYEVLRDLVIGTTLIYRWLGRAIEDTYDQAHPDDGPTIVVNPAGATRTYQAVQFTANKRFARRWFLASSYTLSRLRGNYVGLYDADNDQRNPNQSTQYDAPRDHGEPQRAPAQRSPAPHPSRWLLHPAVCSFESYRGFGFCRPFGAATQRFGRLPEHYRQRLHTSSRADPWAETPFVTRLTCTSPTGAACLASCPPRFSSTSSTCSDQRTVLDQDQMYTADVVTPLSGGSRADLKNLTTADAEWQSRACHQEPQFPLADFLPGSHLGPLGVRVFF